MVWRDTGGHWVQLLYFTNEETDPRIVCADSESSVPSIKHLLLEEGQETMEKKIRPGL